MLLAVDEGTPRRASQCDRLRRQFIESTVVALAARLEWLAAVGVRLAGNGTATYALVARAASVQAGVQTRCPTTFLAVLRTADADIAVAIAGARCTRVPTTRLAGAEKVTVVQVTTKAAEHFVRNAVEGRPIHINRRGTRRARSE